MLNPEQGRTSASKPFLRRAKRCKLRLVRSTSATRCAACTHMNSGLRVTACRLGCCGNAVHLICCCAEYLCHQMRSLHTRSQWGL